MIVCLYVDDLIYTESDPVFHEKFKLAMMTEFDMSDLGLMHYFLGIEVKQSSSEFFFHKRNMSEKHYRGLECRVAILSRHKQSWD